VRLRAPETRQRDCGEAVAEGDGVRAGVEQRAGFELLAELVLEVVQPRKSRSWTVAAALTSTADTDPSLAR